MITSDFRELEVNEKTTEKCIAAHKLSKETPQKPLPPSTSKKAPTDKEIQDALQIIKGAKIPPTFHKAAKAKSPFLQKDEWVYHAKPDVLGYGDLTITKQCPQKRLIVDILENPNKELSREEKAALKTAMQWLLSNTFSRQPREVVEKAFKIFPEDLATQAINSAPTPLGSGSAPTRKSGTLFAPQML